MRVGWGFNFCNGKLDFAATNEPLTFCSFKFVTSLQVQKVICRVRARICYTFCSSKKRPVASKAQICSLAAVNSCRCKSGRQFSRHSQLISPLQNCSKTHNRLKQQQQHTHTHTKTRFFIGRNRTKCANFRGSPLSKTTYNMKTEKQTIHSTYLVSSWMWKAGGRKRARDWLKTAAKLLQDFAATKLVILNLIQYFIHSFKKKILMPYFGIKSYWTYSHTQLGTGYGLGYSQFVVFTAQSRLPRSQSSHFDFICMSLKCFTIGN